MELVGWWDAAPLVTVTEHNTSSTISKDGPVIFASVYLNTATTATAGDTAVTPRAVIAVASWANNDAVSCTLNIDWAGLGLKAAEATITASVCTPLPP